MATNFHDLQKKVKIPPIPLIFYWKNEPLGELSPATLISPEDGALPKPAEGQRFGEFVWRPSASKDVIAEIAEFNYGPANRLFVKDPVPRDEGRVSAGSLWATRSEWHWRIWSIGKNGQMAISAARAFRH